MSGQNRRGKSFLFLLCCALAGFLPHLIDSPKSFFPAISLSLLLGFYGIRVIFLGRKISEHSLGDFLSQQKVEESLPCVDILVSARDEEAVVGRLVHRLSAIKYPNEKINIFIIDDGSQDKTPQILEKLENEFSNLTIFRRSRSSGGGKSGALNYALERIKGEWVFILDADADFNDDILLKLLPFALDGDWSAVQLRKAIVNSKQNFLTSCQAMEMAMDALIQQGRQSIGGVVELRGNGALLNRRALDQCGGFNEETVTDDLDLSFRLLISNGSVGILWDPPVHEEGVENLQALFRQRQRWAEGGLQRFFDYWPLLTSNKLHFYQHIDLTSFFLLQYALPVISFVDYFASILTKSIPVFWPLSLVAFSISGLAYFYGCNRRENDGPPIPYPNSVNLLIAILYLTHWFIVIPITTIKMAFIPKKLVWKKTIHKG